MSARSGFSKQAESVLAWWRPRLRILRRAVRVVSASHITRMSAALAYRTVFGLIPVLAIGVAVLGGFASNEQVTAAVTRVLDLTGLNEIVVNPVDESTGHGAAAPDPAGGAVGESATDPFTTDPFTTDQPIPAVAESAAHSTALDEWLQELVTKVRGVSFVAIGLTGLIMLGYAAISFMVEIERSANQIYRAPTGRSWVRRVTQYWTTLTLGSLFLFGTFSVGTRMTEWVEAFGGKTFSIGAEAAGVGVNILINFVLLFFVYMTVPNARVAFKSAAGGAILAATVWELGKWGFQFVVMNSSAQTLYGALALVPLFLLWVYITWIIVLSGLQLSYMFQHFRAFAVEEETREGPILIDPLTLVRVAAEVARGFGEGKTSSVAAVSQAVGLDEQASLDILERLSKAGVLHEVPEGQGREAFALARPAEQIGTRELLELAAQMSVGGRVAAEEGKLGELRRAQLDAAGGVTLADLVGEAAGGVPGGRLGDRDATGAGKTQTSSE
ncbi:MAG: YhjD/YihY/BrkB family envelope integrity protein [Planctomycetota bacterium]|nr:YhjD/YihY/BrkB family envelope integrity protein [Planctomycetota bacterium]